MTGDSINTQVPNDEIETAHDDGDVNYNLTHNGLGKNQTVGDDINVTRRILSELTDDSARPTDEVGMMQTGDNASDRQTVEVTGGGGNQPGVDDVVGDALANPDRTGTDDLQETDRTAVKTVEETTAVNELTDELGRRLDCDVDRSVQVCVTR